MEARANVSRTDALAACCCVGIALLLVLDWAGELVPNAGGYPAASLVSGAASVLALAACAVGHRAFERSLCGARGRSLVMALGIVAAVGRALAAAVSLAGGLDVFAAIGDAMRSAAESVLLVACLCLCSWHAAPRVPVAVPAAYVFASLAHFVMRALGPGVVTTICVALPLGSAFAVAAALGRVLSGATDVTDASRQGSRWTFPVRPVVLMVVYNFSFYFSLALSSGPNPYGPLGMLVISLATLAAAALAPGRLSPASLYRLALPLMVADLTFLAFLGEGRTVAVMFGNSGNVAFMLFMVMTLATLCHRYGVSPAWMFGVTYAFAQLASAAGLPAGAAFTQAFPAGSETSRLVMCLVVVGVVVLSTVFFNDEAALRSFGMVPASLGTGASGVQADALSYAERVVWQCSQVGRRRGLTQREQEILELMVQGLSAADIAERTCISYGTVKTHVNHVYKKLGVHSREQAIALVRGVGA